jgi:hypothetical protein
VDDFMNKRMGKGEIFYGARQSKVYGADDPGREAGKYSGAGLSDRWKIEEAREAREERRVRAAAAMEARSKEEK